MKPTKPQHCEAKSLKFACRKVLAHQVFAEAVILMLISIESSANLRAPLNIPRSPSSALYQLTKDAQVLHEQMTVECDWQICDVAVKYLIETDKPISATVDFMIPNETNVSAKVGQNAVAVQKKSVAYGKDPREQDREVMQFFKEKTNTVFKATFPLAVAKGRHEISINYRQPLAQEEKGYGYFSKGYYVGVFQYELWPLNEWRVSKDFQLDLSVQSNAATSWWDSLFSSASINCFTVTFGRCEGSQEAIDNSCKTVKPLASATDSAHLVIKEQIHAPLPDRLFCKISPE